MAPFTARVVQRSRVFLEKEPHAHAALNAVDPDPVAAAVPLRWLAVLHRLALSGLAPWAGLWPPAPAAARMADGGVDDAIDQAIELAWSHQHDAIMAGLARPPQTNEVQRSAALLPGLLVAAQALQQPIALLEIGASAGLNLWCDRWQHRHRGWTWGDPAAPLTLSVDWQGSAPPLDAPLKVLRRLACDAAPIALDDPGAELVLSSFVWADQRERLQRLRQASAAAAGWMAAAGVRVVRAGAAAFLRQAIGAVPVTEVPVVMHSFVWQYLGAAEQAAVQVAIDEAAARRPLAWLQFEPIPSEGQTALKLRIGAQPWQILARAHPHANRVEWLGPGDAIGDRP